MRKGCLTVCLAGALVVSSGCEGEAVFDPTEEELAVAQQALWVGDSRQLWMPERGKLRTEIPVCWNGQPSGEDTQARRDMVREAVAEQWSSFPHIDFTGWGVCSSSSPGVHVTVENRRPGTFDDLMGSDLDGLPIGLYLNNSILAWDGANAVVAGCNNYKDASDWLPSVPPAGRHGKDECLRGIARHEFGHVLGFWHDYLGYADSVTGPDCSGGPQGTLGSIFPVTFYDEMSIMQAGYCGTDFTEGPTLTDLVGTALVYGGGVGSSFTAVIEYGNEYALRAYNGLFMRTNPQEPTANSPEIFGARSRFRLQSPSGKFGAVQINDDVYVLGYHVCETTAGPFICGEGYITRSGGDVILTNSPSSGSVWEVLPYDETPTSGALPVNAPIRLRNGSYYLKSYSGGNNIVARTWSYQTADWRMIGPFAQIDSE